MIMKQSKEKFDFKAFGQAIKAARKAKGISRNQLADTLNIAPRYIASIENSGQHPSLQILYELVTLLDVSVDQFFFPEREQEKSTRRRQLDTMLDGMSETDLKIMCNLLSKGQRGRCAFQFHHSVPRARVFAKDFIDFFKISEGKTLHKTEGLGNFPTSKNPRRSR